MRYHEIMTEDNKLVAVPFEHMDPIRRTPIVSYRIMRGDVLLRTIFGTYIKTPEEAIARYQEIIQDQTAQEQKLAPQAKSRPEPRKIVPVRAGLLYHFTTIDGLRGILGSNRILANTDHIINRRPSKGVSLTRDANFDFESTKPFRLALDADTLRRQHRVVPVRAGEVQHIHKADTQNDQYGNEAEEFVVGGIPHLDRCLRGVAARTDLLPAHFDLGALRQSLDTEITSIKPRTV